MSAVVVRSGAFRFGWLRALLRWLFGVRQDVAVVENVREWRELLALRAPEDARAKAELDRWIDELHRAGALDEATLDVAERLIDGWARQHRAVLETELLDRLGRGEARRSEAGGEQSRRDLERRRAEKEYAAASAALDDFRARWQLERPGGVSEVEIVAVKGPDGISRPDDDGDWSGRGVA